MSDLHDLLERESERFRLPEGAAERMWEYGRRRDRNRRVASVCIGIAIFAAMLGLLRTAWPRHETPAPPTPSTVAGTYTTQLGAQDPGVELAHMGGSFELRLSADGHLELIGPKEVDLPGGPYTFELVDGRLTTDALVGSECKAAGTYGVQLNAGGLTLVPIEDACELRRVVLGTHPWEAVAPSSGADPLDGSWTATFPCAQMVRTVERASADPKQETFWRGAMADQFHSRDLTDPCQGTVQEVSFTFRFTDGRLQIFDPPDGQEGFDGRYLLHDGEMTIDDGGDRNIVGRYEVAYRIDGDHVTFDLLGRAGADAFFVGAWESAPFVRSP
jgi:hypothetical protein